MGAHPIFESDFDCLTEVMPNRVGGQGSQSSVLSKPIDYVTSLFWGIVQFVVVFFSTMINAEPPTANNQRSGGRSGGPGSGGPGGGRPGRNVRGMNDVRPKSGPKMNVGGGG